MLNACFMLHLLFLLSNKWAQKESDLRPLSYQDSVLPLNYTPVKTKQF